MRPTWFAVAAFGLVTSLAAGSLGWLSQDTGVAPGGEQPSNGLLVPTAVMSASRAAHTATALPDGRVLVAGGFVEKGSARGAEIYQPDAGRFSPLPLMIATRHSHTATMLPDGRVLIVGGYGAGTTTLATAEVFDPATDAFAATGSLLAPRAGHIAVLLENGKVLVAGGLGPGWTFLSSAELYDPATGRFSPTGSMTVARESHVAVRLSNGRTLIVGGHDGRRADIRLLTSAETYDPSSGTFSHAGDMRIRRHKHDAIVLPNGQVLITGGSDERDDRGVYDSSELFDPKTGKFAIGPAMRLGRYKHAGSSLLLPSGLVLIAGGAPQAETYDPRHRRFNLVAGEARMAGQFSAAAPLRSGGALITGGYGNGGGPRSSAWVYRP
ncbi:MAG: Kelch repeat-containing protein [Gemmatimonadales bacterium]